MTSFNGGLGILLIGGLMIVAIILFWKCGR